MRQTNKISEPIKKLMCAKWGKKKSVPLFSECVPFNFTKGVQQHFPLKVLALVGIYAAKCTQREISCDTLLLMP